MHAVTSLGKRPTTELANWQALRLLFVFSASHEHVKGFLSKCTVLAAELLQDHQNILFDGVYVRTFQPGNFTGWGREGVNKKSRGLNSHIDESDGNLKAARMTIL